MNRAYLICTVFYLWCIPVEPGVLLRFFKRNNFSRSGHGEAANSALFHAKTAKQAKICFAVFAAPLFSLRETNFV